MHQWQLYTTCSQLFFLLFCEVKCVLYDMHSTVILANLKGIQVNFWLHNRHGPDNIKNMRITVRWGLFVKHWLPPTTQLIVNGKSLLWIMTCGLKYNSPYHTQHGHRCIEQKPSKEQRTDVLGLSFTLQFLQCYITVFQVSSHRVASAVSDMNAGILSWLHCLYTPLPYPNHITKKSYTNYISIALYMWTICQMGRRFPH